MPQLHAPPTWQTELFKTCTHEGLHALRARHLGVTLLGITLEDVVGETVLRWSHFSFEMPQLARRDPAAAACAAKTVISVCLAPSLYERESVSGGDAAVLATWRLHWPQAAGVAWAQLVREATRDTQAWLGLSDTKRAIGRLSQDLYVRARMHGPVIDGAVLGRLLDKAMHPKPPQAPAPPRPASQSTWTYISVHDVPATGTPVYHTPFPSRSFYA